MGIKLVIEVLDQYHGADARKLWLLAWAEKANDRTRTGWPTREVLAHRTGRSPSRASHIAEELVAEGVLKRDGGGNRSGPARFILLPIEGTVKSARRTHPKGGVKSAASAHPSDGPKSAAQAHPEESVKGAPRAHSSKGAASPHPKPEVKGAESPRKGAESGRKGADPISLPAETGSLPLIPSEDQPSLIPSDGGSAELTARTVLADFIDWVRKQDGDLTRQAIGILSRQLKALLEQRVDERFIRQGLADWFYSGQHPSTLDSFVNAARNAAARASQNGNRPGAPVDKREQANQARASRAFQRAAAREANS